MFEQCDLIYCYDGSYAGFLCCVFESYAKKEQPCSIIGPDEAQGALFQTRRIDTDEEKARRVAASIPQKMGREAPDFLRRAFLSCLPDKELYMLKFMYLGYEHGPRVMRMLSDDVVHRLWSSVRFLNGETEKYRGFLRFSVHNGVLLSVIRPNNHVLPFLLAHFRGRFPGEKFLIYDRTHRMLCAYGGGRSWVEEAVDFELPDADEEEGHYRSLWRLFYDTVAIKERENPRCRMGHMPKRYWEHMTEFQENPQGKPPDREKRLLPDKAK